MKKLLIINQNSPVVPPLTDLLKQNSEIDVHAYSGDLESADEYAKVLPETDLLFIAVGPNDADLYLESLFEAVDEVQPPIADIVMLSYAGVDDELTGSVDYDGVKDQEEFIKQQRYAIKIVDESEIPYSIIRMGQLKDNQVADYELFNEGTKMPVSTVSPQAVAKLAYEMLIEQKLINHSVGIIDQQPMGGR
ncbi:NAD(P)H-binding protein [Lentilactobacillus otakiensis]|uniref:NAD(P)H-binding protein n=1 Tax=Lentilactobacillus otakiensis TaxID=481720 RepID=UPI001CBD2579|nr:NAD(P)H-binding protein [Lentilactobacillus otakiensis]MBZ3777262.1 SDR family oxidoreductase [Lentilactobacillus otakiensis]MDV3517985.1 NAD(P)H-binding protein [Lentilactobacillus otakiensis]